MTEKATASPRKYFAVYLALMILLAATFFFAHLDLGSMGVPIALFIASLKALLVIFYFMHLRYSRGDSTGIIRAAAFVGVFWLGILLTLTLSDYLSRSWMPI